MILKELRMRVEVLDKGCGERGSTVLYEHT